MDEVGEVSADRESIPVLPRHVSFKDGYGVYLQRVGSPVFPLMFSGNDAGDEGVGNEVFTTSSGAVRIKNIAAGKFWRRKDDQISTIWADSSDTSDDDPNTMFWPVKVDDNVVALRCNGNDKFCSRNSNNLHVLAAEGSTINQEARLQVEEALTDGDRSSTAPPSTLSSD
ncbi:unnamed protein product [Linum trigynum]|uniref:Agglutinin domain-containing protein n=1 Tax=Linum trigynum TaxID=586398 RepID=A0AAV2GIA8_9ROSI